MGLIRDWNMSIYILIIPIVPRLMMIFRSLVTFGGVCPLNLFAFINKDSLLLVLFNELLEGMSPVTRIDKLFC